MELTIVKFSEGARYADPLHHYLAEWAEVLASEKIESLTDLDSIFHYLVHQMDQFLRANPRYVKPAGLHLVHNRPSCCPATVKIEYRNEFIILKPFSHETIPANTHAADTLHDQQSIYPA